MHINAARNRDSQTSDLSRVDTAARRGRTLPASPLINLQAAELIVWRLAAYDAPEDEGADGHRHAVIQRQIDVAEFERQATAQGKYKASKREASSLYSLYLKIVEFNKNPTEAGAKAIRSAVTSFRMLNPKKRESYKGVLKWLYDAAGMEADRLAAPVDDSSSEEERKLEEREVDALNIAVDSSRAFNKFAASNGTGPKPDGYDDFIVAVKKLGPSKLGKMHTLTSWPLGAAKANPSDEELDALKPGSVYADPVIRFYGRGFVEGKFKLVVEDLVAYNFTGAHTVKYYDETAGGDYFGEDQIVTLPGTKLEFIGRTGTTLTYRWVG